MTSNYFFTFYLICFGMNRNYSDEVLYSVLYSYFWETSYTFVLNVAIGLYK